MFLIEIIFCLLIFFSGLSSLDFLDISFNKIFFNQKTKREKIINRYKG